MTPTLERDVRICPFRVRGQLTLCVEGEPHPYPLPRNAGPMYSCRAWHTLPNGLPGCIRCHPVLIR
jgi:hypothetical protein